MVVEERLKELNIALRPVSKPIANYVLLKQTGNLLFVSGTLPIIDSKLIKAGIVGKDVSLEEAKFCAKEIGINILSILKEYLGDLDKVKSVVKLTGYIASFDDFQEHSKVMNGASDLFVEVFGSQGKHSRVAIGVKVLPLNAPVEIEAIFEVE